MEFQLAATNWAAEEEPAGDAQAWAAPASGHPLEYASIIDIFGGSSCSLQPYVVPASSSCGGGQEQLVVYNNYHNCHAAAAQEEKRTPQEEYLSLEEQMEAYMNNPNQLFDKREEQFDKAYDAEIMKQKIHRYPRSIAALDGDRLYTVPRVVAIGPYHHYGGDHLQEAEKVKHVAAIRCIKDFDLKVQDLYQVVVLAADKIEAHRLYDQDVMAGMDYKDEFLPMMFYDACFLVMYMVMMSSTEGDQVLFDFFLSHENDIFHDIMLLENQIPWTVVDAVLNKLCRKLDPLATKESFIAICKDGCLQDKVSTRPAPVVWNERYKAPHLLGLLRLYIVGESRNNLSRSDLDKIESIRVSTSAIELAEMGIFLRPYRKIDELPADMGIGKKYIIFGKISIAPLSLNDLHASMLVNMAALELCTTPDFFDGAEATPQDSAVCSYLRLLCMLAHRDEDVHELRTQGILQGAGLSNNKTLEFFTSLQSLREGPCYGHVMAGIEDYRRTRWGWWLWLYKHGYYRHGKFILAILGAAAAIASILQVFKL